MYTFKLKVQNRKKKRFQDTFSVWKEEDSDMYFFLIFFFKVERKLNQQEKRIG